jgi:predicted nucleotidyltransferase
VFDKEGLLPYVMLIGSWAEYIYQHHLMSGFRANLKTRDVDFLYPNLNRPQKYNINIFQSMQNKGFVYREDVLSGVGKFVKEDLLELEFITRVLGKGRHIYEIPSLKIKAEGLRNANMLADYPLELECGNYIITVPEPEAYIVQKLLINLTRADDKKEKDIQAIRGLLKYVNKDRVRKIIAARTANEQKIIKETADKHFIEI